jgi:5-formyltetrahydrofolate cyclo-ligase
MREVRMGLSPQNQSVAAGKLLNQLKSLPVFMKSIHISMYIANDGEIDPVEVMRWCWGNDRRTYVPVIENENVNRSMLFAKLNETTEYRQNRFGISEPVVDPGDLVSPRRLDLVLLPLVAFDQSGNRIGMGGGFYDTTFDFLKSENLECPKLVGVAHEIQKVESISSENWDIPLSIVVTDATTYFLSPRNVRA